MHKNPENKISQTAHKHYNQFIRVINKALRWLQIATNTGKKTKVKKSQIKIITTTGFHYNWCT